MRNVNVLAFGAVADIIGKKEFAVADVSSTGELKKQLEHQHPALKTVAYAIAVNRQLVSETTVLDGNVTVALLPPFSGG